MNEVVGVLGLLMVHRCWERLGGVKRDGNRGWEGGRIQGFINVGFCSKMRLPQWGILRPVFEAKPFHFGTLPPSLVPASPSSLSFL